ncbi:DUF126 domain-containing protein [Limibaculum sp. FT325]|uniref:aconitase X swivel domain-containing protein n=1 Tax=Thermohalobaculum sediminis TaxID=2939436 RepID=UPI0020BFBE55|nr:DUF126 domain-containing protein [Limibaculum sediminis]MCL5776255.1 DUF126 domain-containing protein [Limibaculum sediminis]
MTCEPVAVLLEGSAEARACVLSGPLSFWGGVDSLDGRVIDATHPDRGRVLAGTILVMPCGRGSSSSASVLAEALRRGTGPAGIVLERPDPILVVGAIVARRLYGAVCPIVVLSGPPIADGCLIRIEAGAEGGFIEIVAPGAPDACRPGAPQPSGTV